MRRPLAVLLILTIAACAADPPRPDPLDRRLLQVGDLPSGFAVSTPVPAYESVSEPPECGPAMTRLEQTPASGPGVREARVVFADGLGAAQVQEVLRRYEGDAAGRFLAATRALLASCGSYLLTFPTGGQLRVTIKINSTAGTGIAAAIEVTAAGFPTYENLLVEERGQTVIMLSHTGPAPPADAVTRGLLATALRRAGV